MARKAIDTMTRLARQGKLGTAMTNRPGGQGAAEIDLDKIAPDSEQPRKNFDADKLAELSANIAQHGVLQAIVVQPPNEDGVHRIIMGERRYRAAQIAGLTAIPAVVKEATAELRAIQLSENIQRQELSTLEIARAVEQLRTDGRSREDIAKALGYSVAQISAFGQILKMDPKLQRLAEVSVQARALTDLNALWKKDSAAVERFVECTSPEQITRVSVGALKDEIERKSAEQEPSPRVPLASPSQERPAKPATAATGPSGQLVFFCAQDGEIGRLMTDRAASSGKMVLISFDNGERIEEIPLAEINLVEAVEV